MTISPAGSLRCLARMLTGTTYSLLGFGAAMSPGGRVAQAAPLLSTMRKVLPLPDDELVVRANGALQCTAGSALAIGVLPRTSAAALAVSLIPTTLAGHAFWKIDDPEKRKLQRTQFIKNMALLGGLFALSIDDSRH